MAPIATTVTTAVTATDWPALIASWAAVAVAVAALVFTLWTRSSDREAEQKLREENREAEQVLREENWQREEARALRDRVWEILTRDASVRSVLALGEPELKTKNWDGGEQDMRVGLLKRTARQLTMAGAPELAKLLDKVLKHESWASDPSDTMSAERRKPRDDARDQFFDAVDVFMAAQHDRVVGPS